MTLMVIFLTFLSLQLSSSIPILNNEETKLNSIVISEIDLPTEASVTIVDQEIVIEPASSFLEMVEKYEGMYGNEKEDELKQQKRSFIDDDVKINPDAGGKSLIDRIETPDPEVRKEFENELTINQYVGDEEEETTDKSEIIATEYDPIYEDKLIVMQHEEVIKDESSQMTVQEKENLQVHLVEQLVHHNDNQQQEFTTIIPENSFTNRTLIKNPEVVEVLEHIVYESDSELKSHEHATTTTLNPIQVVHIEVDPIEIIPKDRHRDAKVVTDDNNDKFSGFVGIPSEDLIQPGEETTEPDNFFKKTDTSDEDPIEVVRETLEYVAIYGKSLNVDEAEITTTEIPQTTTSEVIQESKTEIIEINTKVTVSVEKGNDTESIKKSTSSEESSQQSSPNKSSEEDEDSKEDEKKVKEKKIKKKDDDNNSSGSSEEIETENVAKEDLSDERLNFRSLEFPEKQRLLALFEELFEDTLAHEIKKKDHPDGLITTFEFTGRQLTDESQDSVVTAVDSITKVYEAFEEVITEISDGIKLGKELRHQIESFRGDSEENKIVLDTHNEAISSKNSKNPLVGVSDLEMMKLKERSFEEEPRLSLVIVPIVAMVSVTVLIALYKFIKVKSSRAIRLD